MNDKVVLVEMLLKKLEEFGKTNIKLYQLRTLDKFTDIVAVIASKLVIFTLITLFVLLVTIGFSLYLGNVLGKMYYGFFAVSVIYLVICLLFITFKKPLKEFFNNYFIRQIFKKIMNDIINNDISLSQAIKKLEAKKQSEKNLLIAHFEYTKQQLNPLNIIKEKFNHTVHSGEVEDKIITAAIGVISGFATKKLFFGKSTNPVVGLLLSGLQTKLFTAAKESKIVKEKGIPIALDFLKK